MLRGDGLAHGRQPRTLNFRVKGVKGLRGLGFRGFRV